MAVVDDALWGKCGDTGRNALPTCGDDEEGGLVSDGDKSRLGEFGARLESDDIDVVRGALDDYQSAQADTRWGGWTTPTGR